MDEKDRRSINFVSCDSTYPSEELTKLMFRLYKNSLQHFWVQYSQIIHFCFKENFEHDFAWQDPTLGGSIKTFSYICISDKLNNKYRSIVRIF